ncbi:MAG: glycosyltransferase family 4 protein [Rhodospirillales bacterium]|jgi:glycosyltransferase involved in cell wall biosynthesis|nr:hypothetical protein [Rhodospirillaceae bacterium]MDP6428875.1 glycosyltransferase family 4 protein [Rhodospirillales bacterium]MDP6644752.1 glycosyltransferase family 4 protein [Rhodospirillales bacterium]MDP6840484.1 glycosyltransferase family 4 protein [Rhodospirillales bacterium]
MVVISNGFGRFHMSWAAEEAHRRGILDAYITGAYPTSAAKRLLTAAGLSGNRRVARLLARQGTYPEGLISASFLPEALMQVAVALRQKHKAFKTPTDLINRAALRGYGASAARVLGGLKGTPRLYHYRAGFGGASVARAKEKGMIALCDHSIAHPALLDHFVGHQGAWPEKGEGGRIDLLWAHILEDIGRGDHVLVNSDFVKETFLHFGWDETRLHVIYLGVDNDFVAGMPKSPATTEGGSDAPLLVFAGNFGTRKGADILARALQPITDLPWRLELIGPIESATRRRHRTFLEDARVGALGVVARERLAASLVAADIFVFPSFAEGSARVLFEAMAAGCYIITTNNSGCIAEDGVHGAIVPPGDAAATGAAIRAALQNPQKTSEIGAKNAELVANQYTQADYGDKLADLYRRLAGS